MRPLAVVTGGTRGIGLAISLMLASAGYRVAAVYREDDSAADKFLREAPEPDVLTVHRTDLRDPNACESMVAGLTESFGVPSVLVNNAGSIPHPAHWRQQPIGLATDTVTANLQVTMNMTWALAAAMAGAGRGNIVMISSTYAFLGDAEVLAYTAAKAGAQALTRGLARDLGPSGVRVNSVSPAVVTTEMTITAGGDEFIEDSRKRTPVGRLATPEDIAQAVRFVIDCPMVNGIDLVIDGGLHLVGP